MTVLPDHIMQRVFVIMRRFKQEHYLPLIEPTGVTQSEAHVITAIDRAKKEGNVAVQPHVVAKFLHQSPSAVSQILKMLEEKGFLKRERMSEDFRAVSLELTERGLLVAQEVDRMYKERFGDLLEYIGYEDAEHLLDTLEKILDYQREQAKAGKMKRVAIRIENAEDSADGKVQGSRCVTAKITSCGGGLCE